MDNYFDNISFDDMNLKDYEKDIKHLDEEFKKLMKDKKVKKACDNLSKRKSEMTSRFHYNRLSAKTLGEFLDITPFFDRSDNVNLYR